jgi:hypothetical protein
MLERYGWRVISDQAEGRLIALLREAGVDLDHPTQEHVATTWAVVRRFADEIIEDCEPRDQDGDGLLAQYGCYGQPTFELDMTRQFIFVEDGEYDHMAQLSCTFEFDASDSLVAAGAESMWSFGMSMDAFFEAAMAMPGFRVVRESGEAPRALTIAYSDV